MISSVLSSHQLESRLRPSNPFDIDRPKIMNLLSASGLLKQTFGQRESSLFLLFNQFSEASDSDFACRATVATTVLANPDKHAGQRLKQQQIGKEHQGLITQ